MTDTKLIVAFTGLMGSGKSTAASALQGVGFTRIRFAGPLKKMMAALGMSQEEIEGSLKEKPCDLLGGKTPRWAMQSVGTEWGRNMIHEDLWINAWRRAVDKQPAYIPIVVDDCRFANEFAAVRAVGGKVIRIERPGCSAGKHPSEYEQLAQKADGLVRNDADEAVFRSAMRTLGLALKDEWNAKRLALLEAV